MNSSTGLRGGAITSVSRSINNEDYLIMPIPIKPDFISIIAAPQSITLRIAAPDTDTSTYQYRLNNGSWFTVMIPSRTADVTTRITLPTAETDYHIDVRSSNSDGHSEPISADFTTPASESTGTVPIWRHVYIVCHAEKSATVSIKDAVINFDKIRVSFGIRKWLRFSGEVLTITSAPIQESTRKSNVRFNAYKGSERKQGIVVVTVLPSRKALLNKSLFLTVSAEWRNDDGQQRNQIALSPSGSFDAIVLISKSVESYSIGSLVTDRSIPLETKTVEGSTKPTALDNIRYDLVILDTAVSENAITATFTGDTATIYGLYLLKIGYELSANRGFADIVPGVEDRTGGIHDEIRGGLERYPSLGNSKWKYRCFYTALFEHSTEHEDFLMWAEEHLNFFHVEEYNRRPWRMYRATWGNLEYTVEHITRFREIGNTLEFMVQQR